ncbi:DNA methyltransferase [Aquirufa nivalisilvae]
MKKEFKQKHLRVSIDLIDVDSTLENDYNPISKGFFSESMSRTGGESVYPLVICKNQNDRYFLLSGRGRLDEYIERGVETVNVILIEGELTQEDRTNLIYDLNKQRLKDGKTLYNEFKHSLIIYPQKKGVRGDRYKLLGAELDKPRSEVKELVILHNFFNGDGDIVMEKIFDKKLSRNQAQKLKKVVDENLLKFNSSETYEKLSDGSFDFDRMGFAISILDPENEDEFKLIKGYLDSTFSFKEFTDLSKKYSTFIETEDSHNKNKVFSPILTDKFQTENTFIINDNNKIVELSNNPFNKLIQTIISSFEYGDRRMNSDSEDRKEFYKKDGENAAIEMAELFESKIPYMDKSGSVYVIMDDFNIDGVMACFPEFFVTEMVKRKFHLASRYKWEKPNSVPINYKSKRIGNGFEMVYRFVIDKVNFYSNKDIFIETEQGLKVSKGCTNHSKYGTNRGGLYLQGGLKKPKNTLNWDVVNDTIKHNVANPDNFFRQADERYHTSQYPPEICAFFILESSREGDICCDLFNGVGNTMTASLLTNRKYIGVEMEKDYYEQTCRRTKYYENLKAGEIIYPLYEEPVNEMEYEYC